MNLLIHVLYVKKKFNGGFCQPEACGNFMFEQLKFAIVSMQRFFNCLPFAS